MQGPMAFYKGFLPNFGRLGSWNVIMFLTLEQVRCLLIARLYTLGVVVLVIHVLPISSPLKDQAWVCL